MTLEQQIMQGREGEAELRARFRAMAIRQPITEESIPTVTENGITRIIRTEPTRQQGQLTKDGLACYWVCI